MLKSIIQMSQTLISFIIVHHHHHQHTNNLSIEEKLMQEILKGHLVPGNVERLSGNLKILPSLALHRW